MSKLIVSIFFFLQISFEKMLSKILSVNESECEALQPDIYNIILNFSLFSFLTYFF